MSRPREWDDAALLLESSRRQLTWPGRWTQGESARVPGGEAVYPWSWHATSWCPVGAIERCGQHLLDRRVINCAIRALADAVDGDAKDPPVKIAAFNDAEGRTQAQVLAAFDRAVWGIRGWRA